MPTPTNAMLYKIVKEYVISAYPKNSAYRSGMIVKLYKKLDGKYIDDNKPKNLAKWFKETWTDVGKKLYPVYRPTKRVNKTTPLLASEIDPKNLKEQIALKQIIKGKNLPKFKKK